MKWCMDSVFKPGRRKARKVHKYSKTACINYTFKNYYYLFFLAKTKDYLRINFHRFVSLFFAFVFFFLLSFSLSFLIAFSFV